MMESLIQEQAKGRWKMESKGSVSIKTVSEFIEGLLETFPGTEGFLDENCISCGLPRRVCMENILAQDKVAKVEMYRKDEIEPFRVHDYNDTETSSKGRILSADDVKRDLQGIRTQLNFALEDIEEILARIS